MVGTPKRKLKRLRLVKVKPKSDQDRADMITSKMNGKMVEVQGKYISGKALH